MDRWDWIWLTIVTQLALADRISQDECDAEWEQHATLM